MPEQNKKNEPVLSRRGIECHLCIKCDHLHGLAVRSAHYVPSGNALWQAQGRGEEKKQRRRKEKQTLSLTVCPDVPGKWPTPSEPTRHPAHVSVGQPHLARWGPVSKYYQSGDEGEQTHKHTNMCRSKCASKQTLTRCRLLPGWISFSLKM